MCAEGLVSFERRRPKQIDPAIRGRLGWILLTIAFLLGCLTIYWSQFGDEADNLVVGWLLTRGYVLYRDLFSHHFPFPYYWSAAVIGLFGKSIFAVRLSVWVFQIVALGIAMKLSRFHLSLGLAALIWSILRHLYKSNLVLYSPLCGASLVVVFAVTLSLLLERAEADWKTPLAIGLFSVLAILSDPLSVYAISVALLYLLLKQRKQGALALLFTAVGLGGYAAYLFASGTLQDFVRDAIQFNIEVYARYLQANHLRWRQLLDMLWKGLEILDPVWQDFDPFRTISVQNAGLDKWAFTGLLYRLAALVGVISLLLQKRFRSASFLYLFVAASLVINRWDFRAAAFVMISWVTLAAVVSQEWQEQERGRAVAVFGIVASFLLGLAALWLGIRVVDYTFIRNRDMLQPGFEPYEAASIQIRDLACGREQDVLLGYYPDGTYYYWFTEMRPVSRYVFLWPWVAETGLSEIIDELDQDEILALVQVHDIELWGIYNTRDYLTALYEYLDRHYVTLGEGVYMSPGLAAQCQR